MRYQNSVPQTNEEDLFYETQNENHLKIQMVENMYSRHGLNFLLLRLYLIQYQIVLFLLFCEHLLIFSL